MVRQVRPGQIRMGDVAFTSWERLKARPDPAAAVPTMGPELVIEVLSPDNTAEEMRRKRREFFGAGTKLFWIVDPPRHKVSVYTDPEAVTELPKGRAHWRRRASRFRRSRRRPGRPVG